MSRKNLLSRSAATAPQARPETSSPTQPPAQCPWGGHHRATREALAGIFERARRGDGTPSLEQRALVNVCELRSAIASGEWLERLGTNCISELAAARFALNEVGAMSVAAYFSETMTAWRPSSSVQHRQSLLVKLERELTASGPALDALLATFARDLLSGGSRAATPSAFRGSCVPQTDCGKWEDAAATCPAGVSTQPSPDGVMSRSRPRGAAG
jgi:hypothetical protein